MVNKIITTLEISSSSIKCVSGYLLNDKPIILNSEITPLEDGCMKGGMINDYGVVTKAVSQIITRASEKLKFPIQEVVLIVPSIGFEVYRNSQTTNVVSPIGQINKIDIDNVKSQVSKAKVNEGSIIVDILPERYIFHDGESVEPPYGQMSDSLTIDAKLHAIPTIILNSFKKIISQCGLRICRIVVSIFAACGMIKNLGNLPKNYVLVDLGSEINSAALIGGNEPFSPMYSMFGSDQITRTLSDELNIDFLSAQYLKEKIGIDTRKTSYKTPILKVTSSNKKEVSNIEFNEKMIEISTNYIQNISRIVDEIFQKNPACVGFPVVFVGGGSKLYGFEQLAKSLNKFNNSLFITPTALGARDARFTNCVGALCIYGESIKSRVGGIIEDDYTEYESTINRRIKLQRGDIDQED